MKNFIVGIALYSLIFTATSGLKANSANTFDNLYNKAYDQLKIELIDSALSLASSNQQKAKAYYLKAWIFDSESMYYESLENYFLALDLYKKIEDLQLQSSIYGEIGVIFRKAKYHDAAVYYYNKSLAIRHQLGDSVGVANDLYNIGRVYRFNKEPHEALKYFNEAAALYKNHSNNKDLSPTFNEIGLCYRDMNDSKSAFDYYSKAIETSPNDSIRKVKEYNNIGELYIISGDYKKADKYLADALAYSNQYTRKDLGRIYQNMGIVQDSIGTELKALEYYLLAYNTKVFDLTDPEYLDIIDRLFHLNKDTNPTLSMQYGSEVILAARTLRDLQKDMESLKKQYEVNAYLLEQKNQNQKLAMQDQAKQNIIVKGVISLIACGLMISLVTYIRKRNDKLIEKSDDIGTGTDL